MKTKADISNYGRKLAMRAVAVAILAGFISIKDNPIVRFEAVIGLSPSPIERIFGVSSLFSGMTQALHSLAHLEFGKAVSANFLVVLVPVFAVAWSLGWDIPKLDSRYKENVFFVLVILASISVNIAH